jgi:hypothetical protein
MEDELLKSFKSILDSLKKEKNQSIEQSFLIWYANTCIGNRPADHNSFHYSVIPDGGIDLIVKNTSGDVPKYTIIQSKFFNIFHKDKNSSLPVSDYTNFDDAFDKFNNSGEKEFKEYLENVNKENYEIYTELRDFLKYNPSRVTWNLITLHTKSEAGEKRLSCISPRNFFYKNHIIKAYELSLEAGTPLTSPLILNDIQRFTFVDNKNGITTHIVKVKIKDLLDYLNDDPNFYILNRNVRTDLESEINEGIKKTYMQSPDQFWYGHNGMTVICSKFSEEEDKWWVAQPSVINGAQTLYSLKDSGNHDGNAYILVKFIVIPEGFRDSKFVTDIIQRSNTGNKIFKYDLKANDKKQVEISRLFLNKKIFYERKRNEWKKNKTNLTIDQKYDIITMKKMAQILVACERDYDGAMSSKGNIEDLFDDEKGIYRKIFTSDIKEIFFKYCIFSLTQKSIKRGKMHLERSKRRHAIFNTYDCVWELIRNNPKMKNWIEESWNNPDIFFNEENYRNVLPSIFNVFKYCWKSYKNAKEDDDELTPNTFFKNGSYHKKVFLGLDKKMFYKLNMSMESIFKK